MGWIAAARRRLRGADRVDAAPGARSAQTCTVELGDAMAVVFVRDDAAPEGVTERYVGIRGTPSRVVRDVARERLTRRQVEAGEDPWFPDVAARLGLDGTRP